MAAWWGTAADVGESVPAIRVLSDKRRTASDDVQPGLPRSATRDARAYGSARRRKDGWSSMHLHLQARSSPDYADAGEPTSVNLPNSGTYLCQFRGIHRSRRA